MEGREVNHDSSRHQFSSFLLIGLFELHRFAGFSCEIWFSENQIHNATNKARTEASLTIHLPPNNKLSTLMTRFRSLNVRYGTDDGDGN